MGKSVQVNDIYNSLKVLSFSGHDKHGRKLFKCECLACGKIVEKRGTSVKNGVTVSCGCLNKKRFKDMVTKHGKSNTPLYSKWKGMKNRCYQQSYKHYSRYGGRGIEVCERWKDNFENFYNDMHDSYFEGAELDRINNDGNYEPSNCRWVTHEENANNRSLYKNKTGYTGIVYKEKIKKYCANINHKRKQKHIGCFETLEEAVNARKEFIIEWNKEHNTNIKYQEFNSKDIV